MLKGRSVLPLHPTTKSHLYPIFLILLPIVFTVVVFFGYSQAKQQYYDAGIRSLDKQMNIIFEILALFNSQVKEGTLSHHEATRRIKNLFAGTKQPDGTRNLSDVKMTLAKGETIFAFDSQGTIVLHPTLERKNLFTILDAEGRYLLKQVLNDGKTVLSYQWKDPGKTYLQTKIAVVRYFPQWDWYLCIATPEDSFYEQFKQAESFLTFLVAGSYIITAILFSLTRKKEKALLTSTLRGEQLAMANQSILKTLAVALEERDSYTSGHSQRVAYYMRVIAEKMGIEGDLLDTLYTGGLLHDIGKIGIEDNILLKPGRLTDEEFRIIKSHPVRGEALLRRLYATANEQDSQQINTILSITRSHHERFDGKGYPDQLKGEEIPLFARIAAVADSFDAMTSSRAYRKGFSFSKACDEIMRNSGTQFCPSVVEAFFQSISEETFYHAHQITRANELLLEKMEADEKNASPLIQTLSG
jgi:HD-GYP domain-containing protein (c-di-GMP phosphodiesterase class II)